MSMVASPAASAASRATLPALWPWRTSQSVCGHFCSCEGRGGGAGSSPASASIGTCRMIGSEVHHQRLAQVVLDPVDAGSDVLDDPPELVGAHAEALGPR